MWEQSARGLTNITIDLSTSSHLYETYVCSLLLIILECRIRCRSRPMPTGGHRFRAQYQASMEVLILTLVRWL